MVPFIKGKTRRRGQRRNMPGPPPDAIATPLHYKPWLHPWTHPSLWLSHYVSHNENVMAIVAQIQYMRAYGIIHVILFPGPLPICRKYHRNCISEIHFIWAWIHKTTKQILSSHWSVFFNSRIYKIYCIPIGNFIVSLFRCFYIPTPVKYVILYPL